MNRVTFEWDPEKDRENQKKHGVPFEVAQYAFTDPRRVIAEDVGHSQKEKRYYCFGIVGETPTMLIPLLPEGAFLNISPPTL